MIFKYEWEDEEHNSTSIKKVIRGGDPIYTHEWEGVPYESASIRRAVYPGETGLGEIVAKNYFPDPNLVKGFPRNTLYVGAARRSLDETGRVVVSSIYEHNHGSAYLDLFRDNISYDWIDPDDIRGKWIGLHVTVDRVETITDYHVGYVSMFGSQAKNVSLYSEFGSNPGRYTLKGAFQVPQEGRYYVRLYHGGYPQDYAVSFGDIILTVADSEEDALSQLDTPFTGDTPDQAGEILARNLYPKPSFEKDVGGFNGNVSIELSDEWSSSGDRSLKMWSNYTVNDGSGYLDLVGINTNVETSNILDRGKTYTTYATVRKDRVYGKPIGRLTALGSGNYVSNMNSPDRPGVYVLRVSFTVPSVGSYFFLRLYHSGMKGDPPVWWDDIMILEGDVHIDYFDGDTPDHMIPKTKIYMGDIWADVS